MTNKENHQFTELPSEKYFSNLNVHIHYAEACFETYFLLRYTNKECDNTRWEPIISGASPDFWKVTKKALLETSLIMLQGISEACYKTKKFIDKHPDLIVSESNKAMYQDLIEKMDKGHKILNAIEPIRHKTIAHFDPKFFDQPEKLYLDVNLKIEDLRELVSLLKAISIDISKILFDYTNVFTGVNDYKDVVHTMEYALVGYKQDPQNRPWRSQSPTSI